MFLNQLDFNILLGELDTNECKHKLAYYKKSCKGNVIPIGWRGNIK